MAEKVVSKLRGNMWRLIILAVAGSLIYGLPYFRTYYYDAYLLAYNLTNTQMGTLGSMFGVFGMISYLFGGVVADFISPKKLISISLVLTGVAMTAGTIVTIMADYIRPFASVGGGVLADRLGRPKIMVVAFAIMAVGTFAIALFPSMSVPLFVALCALVYVGMYCNYGIVFSLMDDGGIPMEVSGTAVGVICTIGYLPEVVCPATAGIILDTFTEAGYKYYFLAVGIIMLIGIVGIMIWNRSMKKQKALNK